MNFPDYYDVLGLPRFYPFWPDGIRNAFVHKVQAAYDRAMESDFKIDSEAMQQLDLAFLTLRDEKKKKEYDDVLALYVQSDEQYTQTPEELQLPHEVFVYHYSKACELVKSYFPFLPFSQTVLLELAFVMHVIVKFATIDEKHDKDTESICSDVWLWLADDYFHEINYEELRNLFMKRTHFYDEIFLGKKVVGYSMFPCDREEVDNIPRNAVFARCALAFIDCIIDSKCIDDYTFHFEVIKEYDFLRTHVIFTRVAYPLAQIFSNLFHDIQERT